MTFDALRATIARIPCRLFACACDRYPACVRCGADLYDGDYIQRGWIDTIWDGWSKVKRLRNRLFPVCQECGKSLLFKKRIDETFCSLECQTDWLPF